MDVRHRRVELHREIAAREVDVLQSRHRARMPRKASDGVQFPTGTGEVGQAEVAQRMRAETRQIRSQGK